MSDELKPTNASFSTMWAINGHSDLNQFLMVSTQLGFKKIELNHQITSAMLSQVDWDSFQLSSVHEPCPADISTRELVRNDWLISSANEDSRQCGVQAVKNTIKLASELNAPVVVIHCGNVSADTVYESRLRNLFNNGDVSISEYRAAQQEAIQFRARLAEPRLRAVKRSLLDLVEYASKRDIKLGLENRYHYMDIPLLDEMQELLSLADAERLGFIYDVGHAQALDRLGFFPHEEWLRRFSARMIGCHLHDVIGLTDHQAPGLGDMDFKWIAGYLPDDAFRTLEILPGNTLAQVKTGIHHLVESGCIRYL